MMTAAVGDELVRAAYHYDHGSFEMVALQVERRSSFRLRMHDAHMWATPDDITGLQLAPADVILVERLEARGDCL
jgi:hypothetical protein